MARLPLARPCATRDREEVLHLDNADVERARAEGGAGMVLDLIAENVGRSGYDILKAAFVYETPVTLDGEPITMQQLHGSFDFEFAPAPGA